MALQTNPNLFSPEDLADESLFDDDEPLTRPGVERPRVVAPRSRPRMVGGAKDPDAEAMEIVSKVARKIAVARSLVRIASSVVRSYADQKMAEVVETDAGNAFAHVERARKIVAATKEAAIHAASLAASRATARAQEMLDPEEAGQDQE